MLNYITYMRFYDFIEVIMFTSDLLIVFVKKMIKNIHLVFVINAFDEENVMLV